MLLKFVKKYQDSSEIEDVFVSHPDALRDLFFANQWDWDFDKALGARLSFSDKCSEVESSNLLRIKPN